MEEKQCLECKSPIYGRVDKKFCSDQCRNTFNNRIHAISNTYIRRVNYVIRKNRFIMEEILLEKDVLKVSRKLLFEKGFDFDYYTNIYETKKGSKYFFCYEYGYLPLEDGYFTVVRREEYLK
jgi:hypothetical protein